MCYFAVGQVWRGEALELFGDVVSVSVRVSEFSWSVGEMAAVKLATKVAAPRPTLALFWNFLHRRWKSKVIFHTFKLQWNLGPRPSHISNNSDLDQKFKEIFASEVDQNSDLDQSERS